MNHVMVDLETMGTHANAPILAIGAVEFDASGLGRTFEVYVPLADAISTGATSDPDTVEWWLQQSQEARTALISGGPRMGLALALSRFGDFVGERFVWGNGASFDNTILHESAKRVLGEPIWPFWKDRCYRTMKSLFPDAPTPDRAGHHVALDDARYQARHLISINSHYSLAVL